MPISNSVVPPAGDHSLTRVMKMSLIFPAKWTAKHRTNSATTTSHAFVLFCDCLTFVLERQPLDSLYAVEQYSVVLPMNLRWLASAEKSTSAWQKTNDKPVKAKRTHHNATIDSCIRSSSNGTTKAGSIWSSPVPRIVNVSDAIVSIVCLSPNQESLLKAKVVERSCDKRKKTKSIEVSFISLTLLLTLLLLLLFRCELRSREKKETNDVIFSTFSSLRLHYRDNSTSSIPDFTNDNLWYDSLQNKLVARFQKAEVSRFFRSHSPLVNSYFDQQLSERTTPHR